MTDETSRRGFLKTGIVLTGMGVVPFIAQPAFAQSKGLKSLLGNASDNALDKLGEPGAFYADKAVRILLPGPLKRATKILRFTSKAGLTGDITRTLNSAAGQAALTAKPVFRSAIDGLTLTDGLGIVTGGDTAGSQYLRKTAGVELGNKVRPLIESALGDLGAFKQVERLGSISSLARLGGMDISRDGLTDSVKDQAMDGIFTYIGREESNFRRNPLDRGKNLLKGIF
ncbi:MAG: hypothetical protein Pars2KO_02140 [Parasphingorhabdus sp.]